MATATHRPHGPPGLRWLWMTALLGACGLDPAPEDKPEIAKSTRAELQWKRNTALQRDLMRALELTDEQVCNEQGRGSCTREVHHISLGGADPLELGMYEALPDTLATTPVVVDRVVLSACTQRAQLDREGTPVVFLGLDLSAAEAPRPDEPAFEKVVTALYRRLLSRDPDPGELSTLERMTVDADGEPISAYDFAVLSCFAIGTTTEFLFY